MDLFTGSGPARKQIHDYHIESLLPPIVKETDPTFGPFWTVQVPDDSVHATTLGSPVSLDLFELPVSDSFQAFGPTNMPARFTLHLQWRPGIKALTYQSTQQGVTGIYLPAEVRLDWAASGPTSATDATPFRFQSALQGQQTSFAAVGYEVNGSLARP